MELGVLLDVIGRWPVNEYLVTPDLLVDIRIATYVGSHRPNTLTGCPRPLMTMPLDRINVGGQWTGLGYHLRRRSYRGGWVVVGVDLPRTIFGVADHWSESQQKPGVWSVALRGLGEWTNDAPRRYRKFPDAPRVKITPVGDRSLVWWGSTQRIDVVPKQEMLRPYPRSGPFVDVLAGASALSGQPVRDLAHACDLFAVPLRASSRNPIDRLRIEAVAVNGLYQKLVREVATLDHGIDLSNLVSTGGIATALLRSIECTDEQ
jgi:hypothetical protein